MSIIGARAQVGMPLSSYSRRHVLLSVSMLEVVPVIRAHPFCMPPLPPISPVLVFKYFLHLIPGNLGPEKWSKKGRVSCTRRDSMPEMPIIKGH